MAIIQFRYRESCSRGNLLQSPNKFTSCWNLMFFPASHVRQSRTVGSSAAYKFANMKFHDFPGPGPKFHDFPGLESKLSNSMTFQVFQDRYEPCNARGLLYVCQMWSRLVQRNFFLAKLPVPRWICIIIMCATFDPDQSRRLISFWKTLIFDCLKPSKCAPPPRPEG